MAEKNIIHEYLGIPQLDSMFDEDYFNFEWDMHVGQNFKEHRNEYYRDHFLHQIRNLHMMDVLLSKFGFFDASKAILKNKSKSKISSYVGKKCSQFLWNKQSYIFQLFKKIVPSLLDYFESEYDFVYEICWKVLRTFYCDDYSSIDLQQTYNQICEDYKNRTQEFSWEDIKSIILETMNALDPTHTITVEQIKNRFIETYMLDYYAESYFYKYVTYASAYLSALFHDMGYPICHFLEVRHRLSAYNPTLYMFTQNAVESFDQLSSKLSDSLLFTIVDKNEIHKRLQIEDDKYDHGAYSAIAFLLQFYETGEIHSLSPEKQCAIELSAVAIYNHTAKYNCIKDKHYNYHRPYFDLNPISFLLRICDDLQEWDRRYFEFTDDTDLWICPQCKTPIISKSIESENGVDCYKYHCMCSQVAGNDLAIRNESFSNRKIYIVRTSDYAEFELLKDDVAINNPEAILKISIKYDLYKLLKMSRVNNTYAKFRIDNLCQVKRLLEHQNISMQSNGAVDINAIYLDFFISANPILIKTKILEMYLNTIAQNDSDDAIVDDEIEKNKKRIKDIIIKLGFSLDNESFEYFENSLRFYTMLLKISKKCRESGKFENNDIDNGPLAHWLNEQIGFYKDIMYVLIKDTLIQYSKETHTEDSKNAAEQDDVESLYPKYSNMILHNPNYYEQYVVDEDSEPLVYDCIKKFCHWDNDFNHYTGSSTKINYYADLYLFDRMNNKIREAYLNLL